MTDAQKYVSSIRAGRCPFCGSYLRVYECYTKCSRYIDKYCKFEIKKSEYLKITK